MDLDGLLYASPTWKQVVEFWRKGDFCQERYLVEAIEKFLLTEDQRKRMFDARISIEMMLNGRCEGAASGVKTSIFGEWNDKLGFKAFGG